MEEKKIFFLLIKYMILLVLLLIPVLGIFLILIGDEGKASYNVSAFADQSSGVAVASNNQSSLKRMKLIALTASIINLFISLVIFILFDFSSNQFQFVQEYHEISHFHIYLGVDGLSIYFVLLTTIITPISLLSN